MKAVADGTEMLFVRLNLQGMVNVLIWGDVFG